MIKAWFKKNVPNIDDDNVLKVKSEILMIKELETFVYDFFRQSGCASNEHLLKT